MRLSTLVVGLVCLSFSGCGGSPGVDDPAVVEKIDSFERIEQEVIEIKRTVQEVDAKERLYLELYHEREAILRIAEGGYDFRAVGDQAIIRKLAWVVLGEIQQRRPDLEILVERGTLVKPEKPAVVEEE